MNCRLPKKIGTPSGGTSYPDGAFIPVTKFTAGKTYALVAKIDGVYRYINTEKFNDYTLNATEVSVTPGGGYVTFGSEPALFKAEASGDGFTLSNGDNYLYGYSDQYSTALRYDASSSVWTVDTSETGGFESGKYLPKEVSSSVWLKNASGDYEWSIKYESANASFGYDRAGRDSTYSTGFVSFILYEKWEGQTGGGGSGGEIESAIIMVGEFGTAAGLPAVKVNDTTYTTAQTIEVEAGAEITVAAIAYNSNTSLIYHNGVQVGTTTNSVTQYKFAFTSTVTITSTYHSNNGTYDIYRIDITTEGSSGGGTPSEYALTYSISGSNRLCTIQIGSGSASTFPSSATTTAVAAGTSVTVTIGSVYQQTRMTIKYNGQTVATGSSTNSTPSYTFQMTANTTVKVTQNGSGTSSYPTCVITTE